MKPDYSKIKHYNLNSVERYKRIEKRNLFWRKKSIYLISETQNCKRYIKQKTKI